MKRQQFVQRPAMICDPRRHGRRRLLCLGQTRMRRTKVLDRADQEHPLVQRQGLACQRPASTRQRCEVFSECRVQPFDVRGVDHPVPLRVASEHLHACRRTIDNTAFGRDHPPPLVALDDWGNADIAPRMEPWSSPLARLHGIAKGLANRPDVGHQAIGTDQEWPLCGTASYPRDQSPDQGQVPLLTDLAAQPQPGLAHYGQGHPHEAALLLDPELIGLHLAQSAWLLDEILMHHLALTARAGPPSRDGALVKPKCRHDRLHGTPVGEQGHDEHHRFCRGAQPIEDGPLAGAEGFVTRLADEALLLPRVDTNITLAGLASRMAARIGAEYRCGVHDDPPGYAGKHCHEKYVWTPVCLTTSPHHDLMWSYLLNSPQWKNAFAARRLQGLNGFNG